MNVGYQQRVAIMAEVLGIDQITVEDSVREFCGKLVEEDVINLSGIQSALQAHRPCADKRIRRP